MENEIKMESFNLGLLNTDVRLINYPGQKNIWLVNAYNNETVSAIDIESVDKARDFFQAGLDLVDQISAVKKVSITDSDRENLSLNEVINKLGFLSFSVNEEGSGKKHVVNEKGNYLGVFNVFDFWVYLQANGYIENE